MSAAENRIEKVNSNKIFKQLEASRSVTGKLRAFLLDYLIKQGISSLTEIEVEDIYDYRTSVKYTFGLSKTQKTYYMNLLEQVVLSYGLPRFDELETVINELESEKAIKNKTAAFLIIKRIESPTEIDYDLRKEYSKYLDLTVAPSKKSEYLKAFDCLKLNSIKAENEAYPFGERDLKYENKKVFLLYHPDHELAMTFYYVRDKEELLFDFSIDAPGMMKRQIFKMLNHVLHEKTNWHDRRERFLIPLKLLYAFCVENGIEDIEELTETQVQAFKSSFERSVGTKTETYMQIVDNIRKYLFMNSSTINWNANVWYIERFSFEEGRGNPAREIRSISFAEIQNYQNRNLIKEYMRYQLGVSQKASLQTIRCNYYWINSYLKYLDEKGIVATKVTATDMEEYIKCENAKDNQAEAFNRNLIAVARFYGYLVLKKKISVVPIHFEYFIKKSYTKHNDRSVDFETQLRILKALKSFPNRLRMMYLNLWCIGLRVNEVCVIKGDSYYWDGYDAWIKLYQNKMHTEKYVPIPKKLYDLMKDYISAEGITGDEYVFKNRRGGAYDASTFCRQFQKELFKAGILDYKFRPHDFRHTLATLLYSNGTSIEVIRDYLGHKESDMTKNYLDFIPDILDAENERYYAEKGNELAKKALKGLKKDEEKNLLKGT